MGGMFFSVLFLLKVSVPDFSLISSRAMSKT